MAYAEVHPKLSVIDGRYPPDFDIPRRVGEMQIMDRKFLICPFSFLVIYIYIHPFLVLFSSHHDS